MTVTVQETRKCVDCGVQILSGDRCSLHQFAPRSHTNRLPTPDEGNGAREGRAFPETTRIRCDGCGHEIDPDCCGCGDLITHSPWAGHTPIPMGCVCGYDRSDEKQVAP